MRSLLDPNRITKLRTDTAGMSLGLSQVLRREVSWRQLHYGDVQELHTSQKGVNESGPVN